MGPVLSARFPHLVSSPHITAHASPPQVSSSSHNVTHIHVNEAQDHSEGYFPILPNHRHNGGAVEEGGHQSPSHSNGHDLDSEPVNMIRQFDISTSGDANADTAQTSPAASVGVAAAASEPLAGAGCSARGGLHEDRANATKKRSQPFRVPKPKNNLSTRAGSSAGT